MGDYELGLFWAATRAAAAMFEASLLASARLQRTIDRAVMVQRNAMEQLRHKPSAETASECGEQIRQRGISAFGSEELVLSDGCCCYAYVRLPQASAAHSSSLLSPLAWVDWQAF